MALAAPSLSPRHQVTTRRDLLRLLPGLALLAASPALAQRRDRPARIAVLSQGIDPRIRAPSVWAQFHKRLGELGHAEGKTYVMEWRWDKGERERLPALAAELVALKPDVIVAVTTPAALTLKQATAHIPIVATAADPVETGLVKSLARPGGNITGISVFAIGFGGKWIELLREIAPKARSLAFLTDPANEAGKLTFRELQDIARPLGVAIQMLDGRNPASVEAAFNTIARERIDGLILDVHPVVLQQRQQIVEAAARQRIPAIYARPEYVEAGGLLSYGTDLGALFPRVADFVDRILKGAKPADIPYEQLSTFKMVVNLKTAKALGIKIPQSVLLRAHEVIQ